VLKPPPPSGLGLAIVKRLCADFLNTHPHSKTLTLIFTTRSSKKSASTLTQLTSHLATLDAAGHAATLRIRFLAAHVDLSSLSSVISLSHYLNSRLPHINAVILNAGMGAFTGINWFRAFRDMFTNWVEAVTRPTFKIQAVGCTAKQASSGEIGEVFCANVFGHYYLVHEIMSLLAAGNGRVIWVSSLEAYGWTFDVDDLEGLKATHSYESSKRLTDVMVLTSTLPATSPYSDMYFGKGKGKVKSYVAHPGICATSVVALPVVLWYLMTLAFYIARWLGSPWHTIDTKSGAASAVYLALATDEELQENGGERKKWGSGCDRWGNEDLRMTTVESDGDEEWEELGRQAWKGLEELRTAWKAKLER
jgi:3-keto steroid reductase